MVVNNALAAANGAADLGGAFSPERWLYAGQMTLLGMVMIFAVLGILWAILALFKVFFAQGEKSKEKVVKSESAAKPQAPVPAPVPVAEHTDEELVAILTAAVAAYIESEGQTESYAGGFRVVSFRRVGGGRSWNAK